MKKLLQIGFLLCFAQPGMAQAHYLPGDFPLDALTSFPPYEGVYSMENLVHYSGSVDVNRNFLQGRAPVSLNLSADTFATLTGVTWQSGAKFLGADYGASIIIPVMQPSAVAQLDAGLLRGRQSGNTGFGLGDLFVAPLQLGWHGPRYDAQFSYGFYAPTGDYNPNAALNIGRGYWTHQSQAGGAYYLDKERTWSLNLAGTLELDGSRQTTNFLGRSMNFDPGNYFSMDWGIRKKIDSQWSVALTGYDTWQLNPAGYGFGLNKTTNYAHAIGGEVSVAIPEADNLSITLKYAHEYSTQARFQGDIVSLTFAIPIDMKLPSAPPAQTSEPTAPAPDKAPAPETAPAPAPAPAPQKAPAPAPAPAPEKAPDSPATPWFRGPAQNR